MIWLIILVLYVCFMCAMANRKLTDAKEKTKTTDCKLNKPVLQLTRADGNYEKSTETVKKTDWLFELGQ